MTDAPPLNPPSIAYSYAEAPRRSNGPAIASLVLGILGCIPFITGLLAILFGVIGMRRARDTMVGGKGLAIAGLILGIVSVVAWTGMGGFLGISYRESKPAGVVAKKFLADLSSGNTKGALAESTGLTASVLASQTAQLAPFGALRSVQILGFSYQAMTGRSTMTLNGVATFTSGSKSCIFTLVKSGGVYKVESYRVW